MANQSKLKAWVRYDGTGRVISGGPIFQVNKPKVGNWRQIDANLCCNGNTPTTTTTTTNGGGGTPTAWFGQISNDGPSDGWRWNVCNGYGGSIIVYTSVTTLTGGTYLYSDASLTTLIPYSAAAISIYNGTEFLVFDIVNGQLNPLGGNGSSCEFITTTSTTTTQGVNSAFFRVSPNSNFVCAQPPNLILYWVGELTNGTALFTDQALTQGYFTDGFVVNDSTNAIYATSNGYAFAFGFCQ